MKKTVITASIIALASALTACSSSATWTTPNNEPQEKAESLDVRTLGENEASTRELYRVIEVEQPEGGYVRCIQNFNAGTVAISCDWDSWRAGR